MTKNLQYRAVLCTIIAAIISSHSASGQIVTGQQSVDIQAGKSDAGFIIRTGYNYFFSEKISIRGEGFFETGSPYQFSYTNYGIAALARYNIVSINHLIYLTPYLGLTTNYDHITPVKKAFSSSLNYGIKTGLEAEAALTEKFSFIAFFNQLVLVRKPFGNQRIDYGIGARFYIGN